MKHLKSSAIKMLRKRKIPISKLKWLSVICIFLIVPYSSHGQLNELVRELEQGENEFSKIADIVIRAIKTIAGVSVIIGGLFFLYLRDQQSDLTKKVGQVILGIAIFWILLSVGDGIRS